MQLKKLYMPQITGSVSATEPRLSCCIV